MKISDQIRARRLQLGVSVSELARRLDITGQTVRYWESGRSYPGKSKVGALESALSFSLDWAEGVRRKNQATAESTILQADLELVMLLARLPVQVKDLFKQLAHLYITGGKPAFSSKERVAPVGSFSGKDSEAVRSDKKTKGRPAVRRAA